MYEMGASFELVAEKIMAKVCCYKCHFGVLISALQSESV